MKQVVVRLVLTALCVLAFGCERQGAQENAQAPNPGLIENPIFAVDDRGRFLDWRFTQHSSDTSYLVSVKGRGELHITRTGDEPWGKVSLTFSKAKLEPMYGKRFVFSADVKADFNSDWGAAMEAPALFVTAKGLRKGTPAMLGKSLLFSEKTPVVNGDKKWIRYAVEFTVPAGDEVRALELELGFLMTEGGVMQVQHPALTPK